jgi:UDP-N-acetylglucosamine--N-acetylmuramyl-(pentapeptide) pyrophosphoryl-undecaprenol N-acetylglucosamine transferase
MKTLALTGGGSGGHITPTLAVAHELKKLDPDLRLIYLLEKGNKFKDVVTSNPDIDKVYFISAGKLRRYHGMSWFQKLADVPTIYKNGRDAVRVVRGIGQSRRILNKERPLGIFMKGGFVGVPVGLAARRLGIPFITHDSDSIPGLANRIIGRWARLHTTGMPAEFYTYDKAKTRYVGIPLASEYKQYSDANRMAYRQAVGIPAACQALTITGGSLGAAGLNHVIAKVLPPLLDDVPELRVMHIAGAENYAEVTRVYDRTLTLDKRERVIVKGHVTDLWNYTGAADLVVTRAGATSMAELAVLGQACIVIPGLLADDHQGKNARHISDIGAALVYTEKTLERDPHILEKAIKELMNDRGKRLKLAGELSKLSRPHAARDLAEILVQEFVAGEVAAGGGKNAG